MFLVSAHTFYGTILPSLQVFWLRHFTFSIFDWITLVHVWESQGFTRAPTVDVELPVMFRFSWARGYLLLVSSSSVDPGFCIRYTMRMGSALVIAFGRASCESFF